MSILSLEFFCFATGVVALNYILPRKVRWWALLIASLVFYAQSGIRELTYLLCMAGVTWAVALAVAKLRQNETAMLTCNDITAYKKCHRKRAIVLVPTLVLCIGGMLLPKMYALLGRMLTSKPETSLNLFVPLGLSYFTFQSVGYLLDVYRGKLEPEKNPLKYLLFVSFFPQMTQGPISTYKQLAPQLVSGKSFYPEYFVSGVQLMLWGYFKKMVLADRLAPFTTAVANWTGQPGWLVWMCAALFAVRLYADFSGGMDVIRGTARMLGIDMAENFKRPFFATSVAEYWRRWHITLGAWFRAYLFYPLSTSRAGLTLNKLGQKCLGKKAGRALPGAMSTFVIFLVIGVWHIFNLNALLYGAYFGIIMGGAQLLEPSFKQLRKRLGVKDTSPVWTGFHIVRTLLIVIIAQLFAMTVTPAQAFELLGDAMRNWTFEGGMEKLLTLLPALEWSIAGVAALLVLTVDLLCENKVDVCWKLARACFPIRWLALILLILAIVIFGCYGEGFDMTTFMYTQF